MQRQNLPFKLPPLVARIPPVGVRVAHVHDPQTKGLVERPAFVGTFDEHLEGMGGGKVDAPRHEEFAGAAAAVVRVHEHDVAYCDDGYAVSGPGWRIISKRQRVNNG